MTLQRNNFILYKTIFLDFTLYVGQHKKRKGEFWHTPFLFAAGWLMECTAMQIPFFFFSAAWRAVSPYSGRNWHTPDKCPGHPLPTFGAAYFWDNVCCPITSPDPRYVKAYIMSGKAHCSVTASVPRAGCSVSWRPETGTFIGTTSPSVTTRDEKFAR